MEHNSRGTPRLILADPPEVVVAETTEPCPYLDGREATLPLRMPIRALTPAEADRRLEQGDRRYGRFLYQPACPRCRACESIRIDARAFRLSRNQRRVLSRGDRELTLEIAPPEATQDRLRLFEKHKCDRNLELPDSRPLDLDTYQTFLVDRCFDGFEIRYRHRGRLVAVALTDRAATSLSAVYCYFDPELSRLGIGTYSILKQLEMCREQRLRYLYLGYYISDNAHMRYKGRFVPHERRIDGRWMRFETPAWTPGVDGEASR